MPRTTIEVTIEVDVEYQIYPAEPDVGIMHPYIGEMEFLTRKGQVVELEDLLSPAQLETIEEDILYEHE